MALISSGVIQFSLFLKMANSFIAIHYRFQSQSIVSLKKGAKYFKSIQNVCSGHQIRLNLWTTFGW